MIFTNYKKYERFENKFNKRRKEFYKKTRNLAKKLGNNSNYDIEDSIKDSKNGIINKRMGFVINNPDGLNILENIDNIILTYNLNNDFIPFLKKYKNLPKSLAYGE